MKHLNTVMDVSSSFFFLFFFFKYCTADHITHDMCDSREVPGGVLVKDEMHTLYSFTHDTANTSIKKYEQQNIFFVFC